jgi:predicted dehydrogenase
MKQVRTALVGCGKVGQIQAEALSALPESDFVAVCDSDPTKARTFANWFDARPCSDLSSMIKDCGIEAVFICTPHPLHATSACEAARAGVHVLVEKPLAANLQDCGAIIAMSQQHGVKLGVVS